MKQILEDILTVLSTTPERWQYLIKTFPIDLLTRQPAKGEWSALNCLQHLVDAERSLFSVRFRAFFTGQDFTAFDPNELHPDLVSLTPEQLAVAFAHSRQESIVMIE